MGAIIFFLLVLMFFLGLVQVIIALVVLCTAEKTPFRRHMEVYSIGVVSYFVLLHLLNTLGHLLRIEMNEHPLAISFFFLGAFGLAIYQFLILVNRNKLA